MKNSYIINSPVLQDYEIVFFHWFNGHELSKLQETDDRGAWCAVAVGLQRVRHDLAAEQQ